VDDFYLPSFVSFPPLCFSFSKAFYAAAQIHGSPFLAFVKILCRLAGWLASSSTDSPLCVGLIWYHTRYFSRSLSHVLAVI
jgi:hypothetical protein